MHRRGDRCANGRAHSAEGTRPKALASIPDSNSPSSAEALMNMAFTAPTRPRRASAVHFNGLHGIVEAAAHGREPNRGRAAVQLEQLFFRAVVGP